MTMPATQTPAPPSPQTPAPAPQGQPPAPTGQAQQPNPLRDALSGMISDMQQIHTANPQLAAQMATAMHQLTSSAAAHAGTGQQQPAATMQPPGQ